MKDHGKPSAVYKNRLQRYPDTVWLIWSNKWNCWYRSGCSGYTSDIAQAGLYDRQKAAEHYDGPVPKKYRDTEPFPLSSVQAHIRRRIEDVRRELAEREALLAHMTALARPAATTPEKMNG